MRLNYKYSVCGTHPDLRELRTFGRFNTKKECLKCMSSNKRYKKSGWSVFILLMDAKKPKLN